MPVPPEGSAHCGESGEGEDDDLYLLVPEQRVHESCHLAELLRVVGYINKDDASSERGRSLRSGGADTQRK
jgi:hypothetical protein